MHLSYIDALLEIYKWTYYPIYLISVLNIFVLKTNCLINILKFGRCIWTQERTPVKVSEEDLGLVFFLPQLQAFWSKVLSGGPRI